ncbi:hypothetical protein [Streptomyces sp. LaPpAH-108]|uniref:hypothetical protein n=1 Tax=Streptomyces sp. LaPpAH-108 TaxID=1155714 RepID=UPI0003715115|nr:hypothetical protein [Streptomyces sp. LaPpAH-108]
MGTNGSEAADAPAGASVDAPAGDGGSGPRFTVVISDDGSAAIDGEAVLPREGESVDDAVLDALHRHARESGAPVTAAVRDPSAGYVAHVEVAPDGSSRLLGQEEERLEGKGAETPTGEGSADGAGPMEAGDAGAAPADSAAPPGTAPGPGSAVRAEKPDPAPAPVPDATPVPPRPRARQSDDEYEPPGFLGRPLVVGPVALGVAALVVVPLVIIGSGGSDDGHQRETARASNVKSASPGATGAPPTVPAAPRTASPSPAPTTSGPKKHGKPKKSKKPQEKGGAGGGVTVTVTARPPRATATVTAKPPAETAGTAVNRLAASDPGGRHICYRAYVAGQGWQKPVCDGTMAGTTGRNRAIKGLEIAVRGTGGSAANAFVHKPGSTDGKGVWQPKWTAVTGDGKNFRVGGTTQGAPDMLGFAINVGSGRVCQATRRVGSTAWSGTGCANARPAYVFGGALENDRRLEAVRFTV